MAQANAYIGARLDIDLLAEDDVIDFIVSVFNSDDTDYSFTGITDLNIYIYDFNGRGSTLIKTIADGAGVAQSSNDITLNFDYSFLFSSIFTIRRSYYYKCTHLDSSSRPITTFYGYFNVR